MGSTLAWFGMILVGQGGSNNVSMPDVFMWVVGVLMTIGLGFGAWLGITMVKLIGKVEVLLTRQESLPALWNRVENNMQKIDSHLISDHPHRAQFEARDMRLSGHSKRIDEFRQELDRFREQLTKRVPGE